MNFLKSKTIIEIILEAVHMQTQINRHRLSLYSNMKYVNTVN